MYIEETMTELPDFFSRDGYEFHYYRQVLTDFNNERYTLQTGLSDSLIENNPELYDVLQWFLEKCRVLEPDIAEKCEETLLSFTDQILSRFEDESA